MAYSQRHGPALPADGTVLHSDAAARRSERAARRSDGAAPPADVDAVLARMRAFADAWPPDDGVAVFNRVYLSVTEAVGSGIGRGELGDPASAAALDVQFAARYLAAADAAGQGRRPPVCWRPLFRSRGRAGILPLQFALAGINAHIGHDLALAVVGTCRARGCAPDDLEDEFDRVGRLLETLEARIREEVMPGPDLLEAADPLTHLLGCWSLDRAREGAWSAARALWALRGLPVIADDFSAQLAAAVGLACRMLLLPLPLPHATTRTAAPAAPHCATAPGTPPAPRVLSGRAPV